MPGFSKSLSETQMWQIALLLANADKLPASAKAALVAPIGASTAIANHAAGIARAAPAGVSEFRTAAKISAAEGRRLR